MNNPMNNTTNTVTLQVWQVPGRDVAAAVVAGRVMLRRLRRRPDVSFVKVLGTACGIGLEGSGWVAGRRLVVTNAHVVAGESETTVEDRSGRSYAARAVLYEPRNDLAPTDRQQFAHERQSSTPLRQIACAPVAED